MGLESFSGIWSLNVSNPTASDDINQGDDHIRGVKQSIRQSFPNISSTVNVTASQLNHLSGVASNVKNSIDALSASLQTVISQANTISGSLAAEISRVDTLSASLAAEITRTDTLSSSLQTVLNNTVIAYGGFKMATPAIISASTSMSALTIWDSPLPSSNVTLTTAAGSVTLASGGTYYVSGSFAFSGDASETFDLEVFKSDNETGIATRRLLSGTGDIGAASFAGIISANASDVIKIRIKSSAADSQFGLHKGQFAVVRFSS